jgi:peptidoglycan glycosyltransferase
MPKQLNRLALLFAAAFGLIAAATGYWSVVRAEDLTTRGDNPRRILMVRRIPRGQILDRYGTVLAESVGVPGELERHYPYPALSSLLGYISPLYGTAGLEAALDPVLHGDEGYDPLELWQMATVLGSPPPGRAVRLSLDLAAQQAADQALGDRPGAVAVIDTESGAILALASHPTYDANGLEERWSSLVADPRSPLLNRAILGLYQPGGALAPAILTLAVATGTAEIEQPFEGTDLTPLEIGGRSYACQQSPSGDDTLGGAIARGCPMAVAELGRALGANALRELFASLRLYEAPSIGLPAGGAPPDADISDPALAAIGQDELAISPLQLALVTAAIAEHGRLPAPQLVVEAQDREGQWQPVAPAAEAGAALPASAADAVAAWMAESGHASVAFSGAEGRPLAWYTAFAPVDDARYAVAVLLEEGNVGEAEMVGQAVLEAVQTGLSG